MSSTHDSGRSLRQIWPDPASEVPQDWNVDIVAIHGLETGSPRTWLAYKNGRDPTDGVTHWLQDADMLPAIIPTARIFTYDWPSNTFNNAVNDDLFGHAKCLMDSVKQNHVAGKRLVFIASCFGGLLLAKALVFASQNDSTFRDVLHCTVGVVFLGTPFRGSRAAGPAETRVLVAKAMGRETCRTLIRTLETDNDSLQELLDCFSTLAHSYSSKIPLWCFYETLESDLLATTLPHWTRRVVKQGRMILVPKASATIDGAETRALHVKHRLLNKFCGSNDNNFKTVAASVKHLVDNAEQTIRRRVDIDTDRKTLADALDAARNAETRSLIVSWAFNRDIVSDYHHNASIQKEADTGDWFLAGTMFHDWKIQPGSFLWLHGSPGCGKTILCSSIIQATIEYCESQESHYLAYFYFSFSDLEKQSVDICLRTILRQLLLQMPHIPEIVHTEYDKSHRSEPPSNIWSHILRTVLDSPREIYIIIDALDECRDELQERRKMLRFLESLRLLTRSKIHILVTSRREKDIEASMTSIAIPIGIQEADVTDDIRLHIKSQIESDPVLKSWPKPLLENVERKLTEGAHGMFRWVACQLESLRKCRRQPEVVEVLSTLPKSLDETYERILSRIDKRDHKDAHTALTWLTFAMRPLLIEELAEVTTIDLDDDSPFDQSSRLLNPQTIVEILTGLILVSDAEYEGQVREVRLAHFSVSEYLTSDRIMTSNVAKFHLFRADCHARLSSACLRYLLTDEIRHSLDNQRWRVRETNNQKIVRFSRDLWLDNPLAEYAGSAWVHHARSDKSQLSNSFYNILYKFMNSGSTMSLWRERFCDYNDVVHDQGCQIAFMDESAETSPILYSPPLYYAIDLGLISMAKAILANDRNTLGIGDLSLQTQLSANMARRENGKLGGELRIACVKNNEEMFQLLLEKGADVSAVGGGYRTSLGAALQAEIPSLHIIEHLVQEIPLCSSANFAHAWALRWASMEGHTKIVEMILNKLQGLRSEYVSSFRWTKVGWPGFDQYPYKLIARFRDYWFDSKCKVYMNSQFHVRRPDMMDMSSLPRLGSAPYEAAFGNHIDVLKLFLGKWTNVNETDSEGRTSLYWAVFHQHEEIAELLLSAGAHTKGMNINKRWTPRYWASRHGNVRLQRLLSEHEQNVQSVGEEHARSESGSGDIYGQSPNPLSENSYYAVQDLLQALEQP